MKNTEEKLKKIEEYSKWLAEQLDELCISQSELASAVGKSQKTISRYVNGENMPDEAARATIDSYIEECTVFQGFQHIPSKEFSDILLHLLEEFDVSQAKLAKEIGKHQKNISNYICGVEKTDTETQWDILNYFLENCLPYDTISIVHYGTHVHLRALLEKECRIYEDLAEEYRFGEKYNPTKCITFFMTLPAYQQELILDNISAFVDSTTLDKGSFQSYKYCMELFRKLSPHYQSVIRLELKKYAALEVPTEKIVEEMDFFEHILAYYNIIKNIIIIESKYGKLLFTEGTEDDKYIAAFEKAMEFADIWNDEVAEEIQYKIDFKTEDWHIWMLFVMYNHQGNGIEYLKNEMEHYLGLPEPEEQTEKKHPINTSLMLYPQKDK